MNSLIVIIFFCFLNFCDAQLPVTQIWHFYHYFNLDNILCFGLECEKINLKDAECRGINFINDFNCKINSNDTEIFKDEYSVKFSIECNYYGIYGNRICYLAIILNNLDSKKEFNPLKNEIKQRFSYLPGNNTIVCFNCEKKLIPLVDCIGSDFKNNFNCTGKGIKKQNTFFSINCSNSNCILGIYLNDKYLEEKKEENDSNFTILIVLLFSILVLLLIALIYFGIRYYKNQNSANFSE